ncbi:Lipopolysaccharide kinase (Kdo/WaaP) family protein [Pseudomonas cuatrocienegasensis]|uniref:Lipopolysaccharide kinase (Kdo/WaaP) family protein n=1 Tax=Pseudomonas cuatrocienegasensis TaxID=543360 RepID=A0ABY1BH18_9PSED|nr:MULTISPECIES: lipopolysaccharide kinase InaA family protein [Pseudomonas]OEC32925.1 serine/threonine protein kinase [Pseudomonas sp. 21C1]SEQ84538.1 Lipopolysaccharide kinase (Kdo/WaaP) family protein [Pseudomonas cuatrocienegasensis]
MTLAELVRAGRSPALPMTLQLAEGSEDGVLQISRWLRVLPGQRYVAQAQWQGQAVLAKLLVGPRAARQFQREQQGALALSAQGVDTPALLTAAESAQGAWLLFDYLDGAQSLAEAWAAVAYEAPCSDAQQQVLGEALGAIAQLHRAGLWQDDLHLDNLMRHAGRLYVVDGGGVRVEAPGQALSRERVLANLGTFFAQLPASLEPFIEELLVHYLLVNGEHALPLEALLEEIAAVRRWRLRDYLRKIARDCSLFAVERGASLLRAVRRDTLDALAPVLADPDGAIAAGQSLKQGGSATVARIEAGGQIWVIKRYNIKNFLHWLKRCWRPSRAWHSWVAGHHLTQIGIATPAPVAVIERRRFWLRERAYLINAYSEGYDLFQLLGHDGGEPPAAAVGEALCQLFSQLGAARISHGDLKATNLLWDNGRIALIDLDALCVHRRHSSWQRAALADRARFIRNWPSSSPLANWFEHNLPMP